jgi:5'-phosphate synthase pdxT subunit
MIIGVLALQGDFLEHQKILDKLSVETSQVRLPDDLLGLDGLIIPGGESTTIGKLAVDFGLIKPLHTFACSHAVWGTCAGSIFLSKDARRSQPLLGVMDIQVSRNAFGRQVDSFEIDLDIPALEAVSPYNPPFHAVFIRAPLIEKVNGNAQVLANLPNGKIVAAQEGKCLATSFHPELTADDRFHRYFLEMVQ